ncbi:MAG: EF-hand domain-containing protein [Polaromonas sp.]|nr:EF-hand domain-containing protein [Polaromonas sp.]
MRVQKHSLPHFYTIDKRSVLLQALLTLGMAAGARAQAAAGAIPPNRVTAQDLAAAFKRADVNGDGKLSRQEAERLPAVAQRFEQIDTNRDTFISLDEFSQAANS